MNSVRRKLSELNRLQIDNLYRKLFDNSDGELVLEDIKDSAYCYQTTAQLPVGNLDIDMKIREGMRLLALLIESRATQPYKPEPKPEELSV